MVVFGAARATSPFHFMAGGAPTGFDVDLVRAIGRVMDLDIRIRLAYWQEIRDGLEDGSVQVHIGMTHSPERGSQFDFTTPYLNQHYKIFVTDKTRGINGEDDLQGKRIIVQEAGVMADYLEARGYVKQLLPAPSAAEALRMLQLGEGDCCLMGEFRGITVAEDLGFENIRRVGKPIYLTRYGFAVAKGHDDLVLTLNQGLALLKRSGEYDRIYEKWFGVLADPGFTTWDYLRMAGWIILPLAVAFLMAALWSWSLRRQVVRQTTELRLARDQAEAASEAKSRFLTAVSHEVRTPLNGVLGMAQLLGASTLDADQQDHLGAIKRSATKLQDIINDILEFSRIDAGSRELDCLSFSLRELVKEVLDGVSPDAWGKGLVIDAELAEDLPDRVLGDPSAVRHVLISLLSNAIKFTASGSVALVLRSVRLDARRVRLEGAVLDSGIGVPEAQREGLFDAFTQVDTSSTRRFGGTGLGLAICKHLTGLMGGWVRHEPREGGGSCFRFALVLDATQAIAPAAAPAPLAAPSPATVAPILVVEDNVTNQRVVCLLLKKWGYRSEVAENGQEAVDACRRRSFGAIIMDCQMPVMDGLEATRAIRSLDGDTAAAPIIALTAGADLSSRQRCLAVGMDDYLTKPIDAGKLRQALETQLAQKALRASLIRS
ncbi:MAG: transporter substrate-binding domain-containing protein [Candidatus Krumholzibacteriia bacterium]